MDFRYIDTNFAKFILSFIATEKNLSKLEREIISLTAMIVSYELSLNHVCFEISPSNKRFQFYLDDKGINIPDEKLWFETLIKCKSVIGDTEEYKPIIFDKKNKKIFLQKNFYYEKFISDRIKEMCKNSNEDKGFNDKSFLKTIFDRYKIEDFDNLKGLDKEEIQDFQTTAVYSALKNDFTIISGGPGTGKTTVLARLLSLFIEMNIKDNKDFKFALAAPTGKAAMRMNQSIKESFGFFKDVMNDKVREKLTDSKATTIHRLLKYNYRKGFSYNIDNKLDYDLVVIDEVSMIDLAMFYNVLSALKKDVKIVLIGDMNQLSSVEAGSVLADICLAMGVNDFDGEFISDVNEFIPENRKKISSSFLNLSNSPDLFSNLETPYKNHVIQLKRSFRFRGDSGIATISKMIIEPSNRDKQNIIKLMKSDQYSDCTFFPADEPSNISNLENILKKYNVAEKFQSLFNSKNHIEALEKLNEFKILSTTNQGEFGVEEINKQVEIFLKKTKIIEVIHNNENNYNFKPIMILSNDYNLNLFNGDTGIIFNGKAFFKGDDDNDVKEYFLTSLPSYQTAYAFTIHKSQGSEFNEIFVVLPNERVNTKLNLSKELIYTAITRAKNKVSIVGSEKVLKDALSTVEERNSGLVEKF